MGQALPEECFLSLPVQITPDLARSCADKMNVLLQVQLLGHSLTDTDSAFRLMVDLARELVPFDKAAVLWRDDDEAELRVRASHGFRGPIPADVLHQELLPDSDRIRARPLLLSTAARSSGPAVRALLRNLEAASLLSMPLYAGERAQGALILLRKAAAPFHRDEAHLIRVFTFAFESMLEGIARRMGPTDGVFFDRLTGLFNTRYFEQQLEREMDRARRNNEPVSVLAVEVGDFSAFKGHHGHSAAEAVLQVTARGLRKACRRSDTLARGREDRFFAILPRTAKDSLPLVAHRVFAALDEPLLTGVIGEAGRTVAFKVTGVSYPEDAFSPEAVLDACSAGLARAGAIPGRQYYQAPSNGDSLGESEILDESRLGLLREPAADPSRLLGLFARLCLDAVPADRVSIMVREHGELVVQAAFGFEGQEEIVRTSRIPLNGQSVSTWVAQRREPLLVGGQGDWGDLPLNRGARYRADSFFSYPLLHEGELVGVVHFSNRSDGGSFTREDVDRFRPIAELIARHLALASRFGEAQEEFLLDCLFALVDLLEDQVPGMGGHSRRVAGLAEEMGRTLGLNDAELHRLRVSSRLHDLGKIGYRPRVMAEARALSPRERSLTQRHTLLGWKVLEDAPLKGIDREAILYHHEREDGSGYLHKRADEVPWSAKILAVADVFEALTSPRPYRAAVSPEAAVRYLEAQKGALFDPEVVNALSASVSAVADAS